MSATSNDTPAGSLQPPLAGVRVLDFGRYVAGPYCATLLADFGADVIRVERIGGGEDRSIAPVTEFGEGSLFLQINRNKRSLTLNPGAPGAREVMDRLVASADVVIVNVPDSALAKMRLDYATLRDIRPGIILLNISSFGQRGPWADRPGFDSVGQAMSGSAYLSGTGDTPYRTPITWVDHASAVYGALGVMLALRTRDLTGAGQQVSGSLLGSALAYSSTFLIEEVITEIGRTAIGNRSFLNGPTDTFRTRDGWIVTQTVGPALFKRWVTLIAEPEWLEDPRFLDDTLRGVNGEVLSERMAKWCMDKSSEDALNLLAKAGIPAGPVLSPKEAFEHPQVKAMGFFENFSIKGLGDPAPIMRPPVELSKTPATLRSAPPSIGEHNLELLEELGFERDVIAGLKKDGVI